MAALIVRDIDQETKAALKLRAAHNGRSTEAEVRKILTESVSKKSWVLTWLEQTAVLQGDELPLPQRTVPRNLDLFKDSLQ